MARREARQVDSGPPGGGVGAPGHAARSKAQQPSSKARAQAARQRRRRSTHDSGGEDASSRPPAASPVPPVPQQSSTALRLRHLMQRDAKQPMLLDEPLIPSSSAEPGPQPNGSPTAHAGPHVASTSGASMANTGGGGGGGGSGPSASGVPPPPPPLSSAECGVSLWWLTKLVRAAKALLAKQPDALATESVVARVVVPACRGASGAKARLWDFVPAQHRGPPLWYIVHT